MALCRYIARQPLAKSRLVDDGGGEYRVLLKTPWSDGTSSIQLNTWELMERLIALIPPPRSHQVLYHGVFVNNAKYRRLVLPKYRAPVNKHRWLKLTKRGSPKSKHVAWAELLYRAFGVRGWVCEQCGCRMSLRAVVVGEYAVSRIIKGFVRAGRLGVSPP